MERLNSLFCNEVVPPCGRDCPDRKVGCASSCQRWKEYTEKRNARYAERLRENDAKARTARQRSGW